ncbi:hypothetical protein GOP47_0016368 [Adiantum capillus-veneris]|uniref:Uncharacterized protein n=1 Tax=Adiantum capillus-veneris TaxID=13818 RepID=A0A9D4UHH8_ADICA|nr:hypothetical protein GOP47_0016368 [Adiantum capillus-veneris]
MGARPVRPRPWARAPAVRMWKGYPHSLALYYNLCLIEWEARGYRNILLKPSPLAGSLPTADLALPPWFGDDVLHASHRSNLLRKLPEHYSQFSWTEQPDLPYGWHHEEHGGLCKDLCWGVLHKNRC